MCYLAEFVRSGAKRVGVSRRGLQKHLGALWPRPLRMGRG